MGVSIVPGIRLSLAKPPTYTPINQVRLDSCHGLSLVHTLLPSGRAGGRKRALLAPLYPPAHMVFGKKTCTSVVYARTQLIIQTQGERTLDSCEGVPLIHQELRYLITARDNPTHRHTHVSLSAPPPPTTLPTTRQNEPARKTRHQDFYGYSQGHRLPQPTNGARETTRFSLHKRASADKPR